MLSIKTYKKLHCVKQTNLLVIFSKCNNKSFPDSISTKIMLVILSKIHLDGQISELLAEKSSKRQLYFVRFSQEVKIWEKVSKCYLNFQENQATKISNDHENLKNRRLVFFYCVAYKNILSVVDFKNVKLTLSKISSIG